MSRIFQIIGLIFVGASLLATPLAHAQSPAIDIIPASQAQEGGMDMSAVLETHPPLKLSPDRSEIVLLDEEAGTVVLGNPAHINILVDSAKRLIAVPKAPGASYFSVLNKDGKVIMQRHVLVAPPKEKYVRVRKTCYGDSASSGCKPTQTYYCPDICHEVAMDTGDIERQSAQDNTADMNKQADEMAGEEDADEETPNDASDANTQDEQTQE